MTTILKGLTATAALGAFALAGCESPNGDAATSTASPEAAVTETQTATSDQPTIVALAAGNENLSTLVAAVKAADLVSTLNSDGPFTVFAPPNSAFAALPEGTLTSLLEPANKATLAGILTYHVVAGEVMAADLISAINANGGSFAITTVNGAILTASVVDGAAVLTDTAGNRSTITATDIDASNGVVHLIDAVVMP